MSKLNIIEVLEIPSVLKVLPVVLKIEKETILLVIVYHMPGPLGSFIDDFFSLINELPAEHRMLIVGDFNLDQMLPEHFTKADPLIQNFTLSQHSQHSTIFRHTTMITLFFFPNLMHYIYAEFSCKQFRFYRHYITHKYLCC